MKRVILTPRPDLKDFPTTGRFVRYGGPENTIYEVSGDQEITIQEAVEELKRIEGL